MSLEIDATIVCDGDGCHARLFAETEHRSTHANEPVSNVKAMAKKAGWLTVNRGVGFTRRHITVRSAQMLGARSPFRGSVLQSRFSNRKAEKRMSARKEVGKLGPGVNEVAWFVMQRAETEVDLLDGLIRELVDIPEDRFWNLSRDGKVWVDLERKRVVKSKKISKSDQA